MRRISDLRFLLPLEGVLIFLLFPSCAAAGAISGLKLSAGVLIPALFPVGVLSNCLLSMGPEAAAERLAGRPVRFLFGLSGAAAVPLLLGLLGGFPLGAQLVSTMYKDCKLSKEEAVRLSALCNNAGPAFLIGVAGSVLGDLRLGAALAAIQFLSVILTGFLLRKPSGSARNAPQDSIERRDFGDALLSAIGNTSRNMLTLTGTMTFFHAFLACLETILPFQLLPPSLHTILFGLLEVSKGIAELHDTPLLIAFPLAAFFTGWGGICVHLQAAGAFRAVGLPFCPYLRGKLLQGGISMFLAALSLCASEGLIPPAFICSCLSLMSLIIFVFFKKNRWKSSSSVL